MMAKVSKPLLKLCVHQVTDKATDSIFQFAPQTSQDGSSEKGNSSRAGADLRDVTCSREAMGQRGRHRAGAAVHPTAPAAPAKGPRGTPGAIEDTEGLLALLPLASSIAGSFPSNEEGKVKVCAPAKRFTKIMDGKQSVLCEKGFSQIQWFHRDTWVLL